MTRKKNLYMLSTDATIVDLTTQHMSATPSHLFSIFSIPSWLNPQMQNPWIQVSNNTISGKVQRIQIVHDFILICQTPEQTTSLLLYFSIQFLTQNSSSCLWQGSERQRAGIWLFTQTTNELPRVCWQRDLNLRTWDNLYRLPMICESSEGEKREIKKKILLA